MFFDILFIISVLGLLFCLTFGRMILKSETEQCRYKMYEIRDRLILLVATKSLNQESLVFTHYYSFINNVLNFTDKMHFEGLINAILLKKRSTRELEAYRKHFKKVANELEHSPEEVKTVINDLYQYLNEMMIINSNLFDVVYKLFKYRKKRVEARKTAKARRTIEKEQQIIGLAT